MISLRRVRPAASLLAGVALFALAAAPLHAADAAKPADAKPVATVNGQPITQEDLTIVGEDLAATLPPQATEAQKQDYITNFAINLRLAAAEAEKEKVGDPAEIEKKLAYYRQRILMEALMSKAAKDAVTDEAVKKTYDEAVKKVPPQEEVHARHILLDNEADAKKAYARVKAGEDFAKVAKEMSKDPGATDGGDLGWFTRDRMVKEFADAAFALKPGEISEPVKSQFGWHVIKLEDRREKAPPTLDQVKPQIASYLAQQAQQDLLTKLRAGAKIDQPTPASTGPAMDSGVPLPPPDGSQPDAAPAPAPAPAPAQ
ncbi:peptidylprolyl isomerase [Labrys monachus]|uniref:Parvulin-like PPIase n=1 Tax=Labrys monachus TaxID=217067 RepID=A0ABU0FQJ7_9HYPH|nr:peptidylprolyl isomerase [Labrys monachus]MDQ0396333.1 peptidyl-prolyl cis-trans isomerase C [Labrys monachus]